MPNHHTPETPPTTQRVSESASRLAQRAENAAEKAHTAAVERVQEARNRAQQNLDERRQAAVDRIKRVGGVLRSSSEQLRREDESDVVANYVERASDALDRVASYVASADVQEMARDAQRFARERPTLFYGGAFLLGLAAGRFLKSSGASTGFGETTFEPDPLAPSVEFQSSYSEYEVTPRTPDPGTTPRGNL